MFWARTLVFGIPSQAQTWEDEDEESTDAPNDTDDVANVRHKQGNDQSYDNPNGRKNHPRPPLIGLRRQEVAVLGRQADILQDGPKTDKWVK